MQILDGRAVYSPTDLNDYMACEHLTTLELEVLRGVGEKPSQRPKVAEILAALGNSHEQRYVDTLAASGLPIVSIGLEKPKNGDRLARVEADAEQTIDAMRAGAPIIYQATFFDGTWYGRADILRRIEKPSDLGQWSYEVVDTKLARSVEPYFLIQLCFYSEHVARVQGLSPEYMYVLLGNGNERRFRVNDFSAYYRYLKQRFLTRAATPNDEAEPSYPYPVKHCGLCPWDTACSERRVRDDHLSEVFSLTRQQAQRLSDAGITTLAKLAEADAEMKPPKVETPIFERLRHQARLQLEQRDAMLSGDPNPYRFDVLPLDPKRGFALLPGAADGDVFFDMEGDPYYDVDHGLEYLFGVYTLDEGYRAFWGCDRTSASPNDRLAEKRAFEAFVDYVIERRERFPDMHVYHYAAYEPSHLGILSQRHATREDEIDSLLREQRFVDLYSVVRQSIVISQNSYSIKKLEPFFGGREAGAVSTGDESIVQFEQWRDSRLEAPSGNPTLLDEIERYNEQDCISTQKLLVWLESIRRNAGPSPAPLAPEDVKEPREDKFREIKSELAARIPDDWDADAPDVRNREQFPLWIVSQLLEYYRREKAPEYWHFHDLCRRYAEEPEILLENKDIIVGLEPVDEPQVEKKSIRQRFRFPSQEISGDTGLSYDAATKEKTGDVEAIVENDTFGELTLRNSVNAGPRYPKALIVRPFITDESLKASLVRFARTLLHDMPSSKVDRAAYDLLVASGPRFRSRPPGANIQPADVASDAILALIEDLDDSYLFVQGPPGSGKTYQGAHAVVRLLQSGKRVGLCAPNHAAINHLLHEIESVAGELNLIVHGERRQGGDANGFVPGKPARSAIQNVKDLTSPAAGELRAGTPWAFARPDLDGSFDYMFVDEAGQVPLANAIVVARAAKSVVLLGDPLQLPQVQKGWHPNNVGSSVLEYLLVGDDNRNTGDKAMRPVAEHRGVLLDKSWRMHPDVCAFVSALAYEGRLGPAPRCERQAIKAEGLPRTGIHYVPINHSDGKARSNSEAAAVVAVCKRLLEGYATRHDGTRHRIAPDDIIIVTPYNMQRRCIRRHLEVAGPTMASIRVGTVDKFQGQEADVVLFSTATAEPQSAPRGIEFLFDRHRLNVAISRCRALAIYVGSPALLRAPAVTIARLTALNSGSLLCDISRAAVVSFRYL